MLKPKEKRKTARKEPAYKRKHETPTLPACPVTGVPCPGLHCEPPEFCEKAAVAAVTPEPAKPKEFHGTYPEALLAAGARAAYDAFCREAGYEKDARITNYDQLKDHHKTRWHRVARDVFDAKARFEDHYP